MKRKTEKDYIELAKEKNTKWIGKVLPQNTHTKTLWECLICNMVWESTYQYVRVNGIGCPSCGIKRRTRMRAHTKKDYHAIAKSKGLLWLGESLPKNTKTKTLWQCVTCNYKWLTHYNNVHNSVVSCPECGKEENIKGQRKNAQDYHSMAEKRNIEWAGEFPQNTHEKTLWKCKKCGHEWMGRYNDIHNGYGCQSCANMVNGKRVSVSQLKLADKIGGIVNYHIGSLWVDIGFPDRKIAIEYDAWFWHSDKQERDTQRVLELIDLGWKVLAIKSNLKVPSKKDVLEKIRQLSPDTPYTEMVLSDWGRGVTNNTLERV